MLRNIVKNKFLNLNGFKPINNNKYFFSKSYNLYENFDYDLVVIGAGPSGFATSSRAFDLNKKVCLISENLGGSGVTGALASKLLWQHSNDYRTGLTFAKETDSIHDITFPELVERVKEGVTIKENQLQLQLDELKLKSDSGHSKGKIDFVRGRAKFTSKNMVNVITMNENGEHSSKNITADNFVIATGSYPRMIPEIEKSDQVFNSDDIFSLKKFPKRMIIVGAGVIGCEFAAIFGNFGKTEVHLINAKRDRLLPTEGRDVSDVITNNFEALGVHVHNNVLMDNIKDKGDSIECTLSSMEDPNKKTIIDADCCLLSIGRIPNTANIGLENIGVEISKRSGIVVDDDGQSTIDNIYAVGDSSIDIGLVSVGENEARYVAELIFGLRTKEEAISYESISSIMFLSPEVACVGYSEFEAKKKFNHLKISVVSYLLNNRAIVEKQSSGFVKLIVDVDTNQLIGMRAIGKESSSLASTCSYLIKKGASVDELEDIFYAHPSISELLLECARLFNSRSIIQSDCFPDKLIRCYEYKRQPTDQNGSIDDESSRKPRKSPVPTYK